MRQQAAVLSPLISLVLIVVAGGMVQAWVWAIRRLRQGLPLLPPSEPRAVPWGFRSVLLVLLTWFATNVGVVSTWMMLTGGCWPRRELTLTEQMFLMGAINGLVLLLVPPVLRLTARARLADLGIRKSNLGRDIWTGVMAFLLFTPVVYALNGLALLVWSQSKHPLEQMVRLEASEGIFALAFLSAVVLAPAAEELIFRGVIQGWFERVLGGPPLEAKPPPEDEHLLVDVLDLEPLGGVTEGATARPEDSNLWEPPRAVLAPGRTRPRSSWLPPLPRFLQGARALRGRSGMLPIVITSALFAVVHLPQWPAPLPIFILSLGLGAVYQRSGSLVSSFVMHACFNAVATLLLFVTVLNGGPPHQ